MAGTSLGTAWIQIKPSMAGITSELKRELGASTKDATTSMQSAFATVFSGLGENIKSTFSAAFSSIAGTAKSTFTAAFAGITGMIATSIDGAISRIDTLNNAERMFTALGYSTESITASMDDLNQYLNGLPTSLDDAVRQVQLLSTSFGGIENGTKYFKALNDAGLAFGASTDQIKNGITQLSQLSLDGPLDAETWNSLRDSGFSPVFAAMAKEAGITTGELKEQFGGNGYRTVQEFLDELIRLDEEGSGSMKSLAEMARSNTDGIATSFTNMRTAIKRGTASIIEGIPDLAGSLSRVGTSIEGLLKGTVGVDEASAVVSDLLANIIGAVGGVIEKTAPLVLAVLPRLISTVVDGIVGLLSNQEQANKLIEGFVQLFVAVATGASRIAMAIIPLIPTIIATIVGEITKPENIGNLIAGFGILLGYSTFKTIASNMGNILTKTVGSRLTGFFKKDLAVSGGQAATSGIGTIGDSAARAVKGIGNVLTSALQTLGNILSAAVKALLEPLGAMLKGIGQAIGGFFKVFADPMILAGAAVFTAVAAAIAAAIFLIGSAIGAIMPTITSLFNDILIPLFEFVANTIVIMIQTLTNAIVILVNSALIPLGQFLTASFIAVITTVADVITQLTNGAIIPLANTLSGTFTSVITAIAGLITGTLQVALEGIASVVDMVGDGFVKMGEAIKLALDGVNGILGTFRDLILGIADAIVAVVALATGQSINYGTGFARVTRAAMGGRVDGIGTETSDSNLFALSKGEYVIRAAAAKRIGYENLDSLNASGKLTGGTVYNYITINSNQDPNEIADMVSRKIALKTKGVIG